MKFVLTFLALAVVALAEEEVVFKYEDEETNQMHYMNGVPGTDVNGGWEFQSPEGKAYKMQYVANDMGFQPQADYLPQAPLDTNEVQVARDNFYSAYEAMKMKIAEAQAQPAIVKELPVPELPDLVEEPEVDVRAPIIAERKRRSSEEVMDDQVATESEATKSEAAPMEKEMKKKLVPYHPYKPFKPLRPYFYAPYYYKHPKVEVKEDDGFKIYKPVRYFHHYHGKPMMKEMKDEEGESEEKPAMEHPKFYRPYFHYHHHKKVEKAEEEDSEDKEGQPMVKYYHHPRPYFYHGRPYYYYHHGKPEMKEKEEDPVKAEFEEAKKKIYPKYRYGPFFYNFNPLLPPEEMIPKPCDHDEEAPAKVEEKAADATDEMKKKTVTYPVHYHGYWRPRPYYYYHMYHKNKAMAKPMEEKPEVKEAPETAAEPKALPDAPEVAETPAVAPEVKAAEPEVDIRAEVPVERRRRAVTLPVVQPLVYHHAQPYVYTPYVQSVPATFVPSSVQVTKTTVGVEQQGQAEGEDGMVVTTADDMKKDEKPMMQEAQPAVPVQPVVPFYPGPAFVTQVQQHPTFVVQQPLQPVVVGQPAPVVVQKPAPLPEKMFPVFPTGQDDQQAAALAF